MQDACIFSKELRDQFHEKSDHINFFVTIHHDVHSVISHWYLFLPDFFWINLAKAIIVICNHSRENVLGSQIPAT